MLSGSKSVADDAMAARPATAPRVVVLMGVAGAGKTYVGKALAAATGWPFLDADDFHSKANKEKMHRGEPLTDADREPWLEALRDAIDERLRAGASAVLACSALRQSYRDTLVPEGARPGEVRFVYLEVPRAVLRERLATRPHHFAGPSLLASQLETLEEPRDALRVDGTRPAAEIVSTIRAAFEI